jgi:hypothetical protein
LNSHLTPRKASEAALWVELLMDVDETRAVLQRWQEERRKISPADVHT